MRRLRDRAGLLGQKWPLQHTLLRRRVPGAALKEGGHDQLCKKIKAGGAEQYHANKKHRGCRVAAVRGRH